MNLRRIKFKAVSFIIGLFKRPVIKDFELRISSDRNKITPIGKLTPIGFDLKQKRISKFNIEVPKMVHSLMPLNAVCINSNWFKAATPQESDRFDREFRSINLTDWKKI